RKKYSETNEFRESCFQKLARFVLNDPNNPEILDKNSYKFYMFRNGIYGGEVKRNNMNIIQRKRMNDLIKNIDLIRLEKKRNKDRKSSMSVKRLQNKRKKDQVDYRNAIRLEKKRMKVRVENMDEDSAEKKKARNV
ncbi:hypothetical protein TSAR_015823, partial [Trichomalopsis sarcophagae]